MLYYQHFFYLPKHLRLWAVRCYHLTGDRAVENIVQVETHDCTLTPDCALKNWYDDIYTWPDGWSRIPDDPLVNEGDFIIITQEEKKRYLKDAVVCLSVAGISQEELDKINTEEER